MKRLNLILVAGIGLLVLAACASNPGMKPVGGPNPSLDPRREIDERLAGSKIPRILFVGNSYSFGMPAAFAKFAAAQRKKVRTGHSTQGGWSLAQHAAHEPTLRKIRSGKWDIVVLQEFSLLPAMPRRQRDSAMFPAVRLLAEEARKAGAIPVLFQTWGRRDGDKGNARFFPQDDFFKMNRRLREGYAAASTAAGGIFVVPAGDAWEAEMSAGTGLRLFQDDGSHPSPAGDELNAKTFYHTLFR